MNSYQLISKLRKVRADTYLTAADQALFHELVALCNELKWKEVFLIRSNVLCGNLNMSDNTLRKSRKALADAHLLSFETCKDKRVGCYYSFLQKLSNDVVSPAISSAKIEDDIAGDVADETADDIHKQNRETSSRTSTFSSSISSANFEDDKKGSSATSSAKFEDDMKITPIKDNIKTINEESHAHMRETLPPRKGKSSRKKEEDEKPLEYPFTSIRFMSTWEALRKTPKWKNKLNYALQLSLNKLGKFEEDFAIEQMERAIESNWTGVVFPGTEEKYQEWLKLKYGKSTDSPKPTANKSAAERKESVDRLTDLAGNVLRAIAAEKLK